LNYDFLSGNVKTLKAFNLSLSQNRASKDKDKGTCGDYSRHLHLLLSYLEMWVLATNEIRKPAGILPDR